MSFQFVSADAVRIIVMVSVDTSDADMAEGAAAVETTKIDTEAIVASCCDRSKSRSSSKSEHSR